MKLIFSHSFLIRPIEFGANRPNSRGTLLKVFKTPIKKKNNGKNV